MNVFAVQTVCEVHDLCLAQFFKICSLHSVAMNSHNFDIPVTSILDLEICNSNFSANSCVFSSSSIWHLFQDAIELLKTFYNTYLCVDALIPRCNNLPRSIRSTPNLVTFRSRFRVNLLDDVPYKLQTRLHT